jgi:hypothetical protein
MSTQLSAEGAHREAVAKPSALCADGYPDVRKRDAEHEFVSAVHESAALQGVQAESPPRVVDVKVHHAGIINSSRISRGYQRGYYFYKLMGNSSVVSNDSVN